MEHYYSNVVAPTTKQDWILDLFDVTNLVELPLRVTEEFMKMTAEPASQIPFSSFKEKHPKISTNINFCVSIHSSYLAVSV